MSSIGTIVDLPMEKVFADTAFNCRGAIAPLDVIDLARDIEARGLQYPIVVQPMPDGRYRIVSGHRRHMAHRVNKADKIACIVRDFKTDLAARAENLKENLVRTQLNMQQESNAILPFIVAGWTEKMIATELQQSQSWVHIRKVLLTLPKDIQAEAAAGFLTQAQILVISKLPLERKYEAVREIKEKKLRGEKVKLDKPKRKIDLYKTKERNKSEILDMINALNDVAGMGLHTRCLAWAAGTISTWKLLDAFRDYCAELGIQYEVPKDVDTH